VGKPFSAELDSLSRTYDWAAREPVDGLVRAVRAASGLPLLAVGSGGSFTAAHFVCEFHRFYTRNVAQALTPLQLVGSASRLRDLAVVLPSAGGNNPDVLGAFGHLVGAEPRRLLVWCANPGSRLSRAAAKYRYVDLHEFAPPSGKDGFLAMNSLVAFAVLFARAYADSVGSELGLPGSFDDLLAGADWRDPDVVDGRCEGLWGRETLVLLHGPSTLPAAIDVESKFTEAALGSVQIADFRHFAHGRHHWIAKRRRESAVLAITSDDDRELAESVLSLLPSDVPVLRINAPYSGCLAAVSAMAQCFFLVASAGRVGGIDPGDPGVPTFGRRIYHLNVYEAISKWSDLPPDEVVAVERKSGEQVDDLARSGRLAFWRDAYAAARATLIETSYCGIVLDYDGTLCYEAERYGPLPEKMAVELSRLLRAGTVVGIATGRGKSVRKSLQQAIPERLWKRVVIGYYNGAEVGMLADDGCPDDREEAGPELQPVAERLGADGALAPLVRFTVRMRQITLTPAEGVFPGPLWEHVHSLLLLMPGAGAVALRSGHSVDIIGQTTTKLAVVERVQQLAGCASGAVLRIGDRGRWPGNDHALLASPHAVSADEVSPVPEWAWNFAPPGHRGAQATLGYLRQIGSIRGTLRFTEKSARRNGR
jgi:hypothetical protein